MDGNQKVRESSASQFHYGGKTLLLSRKKLVVSASFQEKFIQEHPLLPKEDE